MPAAGFAIDLLPGRGLERGAHSGRDRSQRAHHLRHDGRVRAGARARAPAPAPRGRRGRRLRVASGPGRGPGPAHPGGRARGRRPSRAREPDRGAARRPGGGDASRDPAARRRGHRQPHPARDRARSSALRSTPRDGRGRRRQPGRPFAEPGRARAATTAGGTAATSRSTTSAAPATTKSAAPGSPALRAAGDSLSYSLVPFEEHMEVVYAEATLVVSRSGGMTAELTAVGMPSVLVPLPGAPGDHQTANADALVAAGAAVKIADADLDPVRLVGESTRCSPTRPRWRAWARRRGRSVAPTRPRASPTWSKPRCRRTPSRRAVPVAV